MLQKIKEAVAKADKCSSNSLAASGNQYWFSSPKVKTGRVFYRIDAGGCYRYVLLFGNVVDGTFSNGSVSRCNRICGEWKILGGRIGRCRRIPPSALLPAEPISMSEDGLPDVGAAIVISDFRQLLFKGEEEKTVEPGEIFESDPVEMTFESGEYLCLELTFQGEEIPGRWESVIPSYVRSEAGWIPSMDMPLSFCIGCDRPVKGRIGYLGDSITQGIGTEMNRYENWCAVLSEKIKEEFGPTYAFWNLGLGFGRAADAASDGVWLAKAKLCDLVVVCYGVNDLFADTYTTESLCRDFVTLVSALKRAGCRVILQTVPPFDYRGADAEHWMAVNEFLKTKLAPAADGFFDVVPILGKDAEHPFDAAYGGHPDRVGCAKWAASLYPIVRDCLKDMP